MSPPQPHPWRHTLGGDSVRVWPPPPLLCWSTACTHACVAGVNTSGEPLVGTRNVAQLSLHQLIATFLYKIVILSGNYLLPLAVGSVIVWTYPLIRPPTSAAGNRRGGTNVSCQIKYWPHQMLCVPAGLHHLQVCKHT